MHDQITAIESREARPMLPLQSTNDRCSSAGMRRVLWTQMRWIPGAPGPITCFLDLLVFLFCYCRTIVGGFLFALFFLFCFCRTIVGGFFVLPFVDPKLCEDKVALKKALR